MSLAAVFDIAGSGMSAQTMRLNTLASNLANAETISGSAEGAYKSKHPIFKAVMDDQFNQMFSVADFRTGSASVANGGVEVTQILESKDPAQKRYMPSHPLADEEGYTYTSNVNIVEEMADMISASRSFEMNAEVANTAKSMMQRLITLGR